MGKKKKKKKKPPRIPQATLNFQLEDGTDDGQGPRGEPIGGRVEDNGHTLDICLDGYGTNDTMDGFGSPICLDYFDGKLQLVVWGDINDQEPTHKIDLAGALNSRRMFASDEEVDAAWQEMLRIHIAPSRLFRLAMNFEGAKQTEKEDKHLRECRICSRTLLAYKESI